MPRGSQEHQSRQIGKNEAQYTGAGPAPLNETGLTDTKYNDESTNAEDKNQAMHSQKDSGGIDHRHAVYITQNPYPPGSFPTQSNTHHAEHTMYPVYYVNPHQSSVSFLPSESPGQPNTRTDDEPGNEQIPVSAYPIPVYQPPQFYYSGAPFLGAYAQPNVYCMPMSSPPGPPYTIVPQGDTGKPDASQLSPPLSSSTAGFSDTHDHESLGYPNVGHSPLPTNYAYPYPYPYPYYGYPNPSVMPSVMGHPYPILPGYRMPERTQRGRRQSNGRRRTRRESSPARKTSEKSKTPSPHDTHATMMEQGVQDEQTETGRPHSVCEDKQSHTASPQRRLAESETQKQGVRSNYVMWCGNVAQDATLEELWAFFSSIENNDTLVAPADVDRESTPTVSRTAPDDELHPEAAENPAGILSIFIISRSSCAFVNYSSEDALERACAYFNGKQLRAKPNSPKLVCRPRKKEDAEYAGVAAQRGKGVHVAWFKQQKQQQQRQRMELMFSKATLAPEIESRLNVDDNVLEEWNTTSSSSGDSRSFASTNSSLLHQPEFSARFFILKSSTRDALEAALKNDIWSTQPHNEGVLNQAFRNSQHVYLLFSENLSGQLFGCAIMSSQISRPTSSGNAQQGESHAVLDDKLVAEPIAMTSSRDGTPETRRASEAHEEDTAPDDSTSRSPPSVASVSASIAAEIQNNVQLASNAMMHNFLLDLRANDGGDKEQDGSKSARGSTDADTTVSPTPQQTSAYGRTFSLRWIITRPLPFSKIQHLRNPWRDNRLVKVSRDGTELEPHVGEELLKVWESYLSDHPV